MRRIIYGLLLLSALSGRFAIAEDSVGFSKMQNMDLRNCQQKKCIRVHAEFAESGNYTPLMSLKNIEMDYYQGSKKMTYNGAYGYIDYLRNVVTFRVSPKKELSLSLNDLVLREFPL